MHIHEVLIICMELLWENRATNMEKQQQQQQQQQNTLTHTLGQTQTPVMALQTPLALHVWFKFSTVRLMYFG